MFVLSLSGDYLQKYYWICDQFFLFFATPEKDLSKISLHWSVLYCNAKTKIDLTALHFTLLHQSRASHLTVIHYINF